MAEEDNTGDPNCPVCEEDVQDGQDGIYCDMCHIWFHQTCLHLNDEFVELINSELKWFCSRCLLVKSNSIKLG